MKSLVECVVSLVVCIIVASNLSQNVDAGQTIKLPFYDVTFGTWPLMEVTKTGNPFKRKRGRAKHGGPPRGRHPKRFRLGPPPRGKLVLVNPNDKGTLHQHLQANLKHFADKPVNLKLPIIVKTPGPHPPPPPPGYQLGHPSSQSHQGVPLKLTNINTSWKPGPPGPNNPAAPLTQPGGRNSRLFSILKNAAVSGMFGAGFNTYQAPEVLEGRPYPGPHLINYPDGTQVATFVNEGVMSLRNPNILPSAEEVKPSLPPVISIGGNLPDNYKIVLAQRQYVGVKSPDTLENSGSPNPGLAEYDLALNLGGNYEHGYGPKPRDKPPLLIQKFQKRGDHHKLINQELPDTSLVSTSSFVFSTPNISAPLGGKSNPHFQAALEDKRRILKHKKKEKPLDAQVKLLGRLFTKLQRLKPPKITVAEEDEEPYSNDEDEDDGGWKKKAKTKVDSPVMAVQIQTYTAPEIDSKDPDIVEAMAEFGNHDVEFAETDDIINLMDGLLQDGTSRINIRDLGSNPQEINANMLEWIRHHLAVTRTANQKAQEQGEGVANQLFRQYQTFVTPPGGGNGWGPTQAEPVDPKKGSKSMVLSFSHGVAVMEPKNT